MNEHEKSDNSVVPKRPANKAGLRSPAAELEEGRELAKGNPKQQTSHRTQSRGRLSQALERIRSNVKGNKKQGLTTLWHHVYDVDRLREAYHAGNRTGAAGVDGETWRGCGENLEANLRSLSERLSRGSCRAQPVERCYIPKTDGKLRSIGVPVLEDRIVQRATVEVLNAVYECHFKGFSYGFRPGRSQNRALDALYVGLTKRRVNWVLDADIRGCFDGIDHEWLITFVEHLISFGLELHPGKTRLIEFGRYAKADRQRRGEGKPETFDFLGFTHYCAEKRTNGRFIVGRKTIAKRMRAKLRELKVELRRRMHRPVPEPGAWLRRVVQGYYNYHSVPRNGAAQRCRDEALYPCTAAVVVEEPTTSQSQK